jgi:hypothetical protein
MIHTPRSTVIENPWHRLPEEPPFVLPRDREKVEAFNERMRRKADDDHILHLDLIPEPFVGRPDAPLVILGNNPGVTNEDTAKHRRTRPFVNRMRKNLLQQLSDDFPFLYLDPSSDISEPSREWWQGKLKRLHEELGGGDTAWSILARSVLAVEFFPYSSHRFNHGKLRLPSQDYSFDLVRKAMNRGATVVVTRGERRWQRAIPELLAYDRLVRLMEHQRATISPGNCRGNGFQEVVQAIMAVCQRR